MHNLLPSAAIALLLALPAFAQQSNVNLSYNPQKDTEGLVPFSANLNSPQVNHDIEYEYFCVGKAGHDWSTWRGLLYYGFLPNLWK